MSWPAPTDHRMERAGRARRSISRRSGARRPAALDAAWDRLAGGPGAPLILQVQGRDVTLPRRRGRVARASFADLCGRPLGPADYLALGRGGGRR